MWQRHFRWNTFQLKVRKLTFLNLCTYLRFIAFQSKCSTEALIEVSQDTCMHKEEKQKTSLDDHCFVCPSSKLLYLIPSVRWPLFCLSFFKVTVPDFLCTMTIALSVLLQSYCTWFPLYDDHSFVCPSSKLLYLILSVRWPLLCLTLFKVTVPDSLCTMIIVSSVLLQIYCTWLPLMVSCLSFFKVTAPDYL